MDNCPIFEWNPGDLIVNVDDDPDALHEEMDEVEYPDDNGHDDQDPDVGGIPGARGPTIITDNEELEELDEDRSNDANEYKGDWTNELNKEENVNDSEGEYDSRSDTEDNELEDKTKPGRRSNAH